MGIYSALNSALKVEKVLFSNIKHVYNYTNIFKAECIPSVSKQRFYIFLCSQLDFLKILFFQTLEYHAKSTMACDYSGVSRLFSSSYVSNLDTYMYAQENSLLFCITITNCNIYVFQ